MRDIEEFGLQAPQTSEGRIRNNNIMSEEVVEYLKEENADLREYFTSKPINDALSKSFKMTKEEGIAVQIAGNAEVPRAEQTWKLFTIYLHRNATGYKIDDDDRDLNKDNPDFEPAKMRAALKRMLRKEIKDMGIVMLAGYESSLNVATKADFTVEAIKDAAEKMNDNNRYVEPDTVFMSYKMFRQLQKDPAFQYIPEVFQSILLKGTIEGESKGRFNGKTGQEVDGMDIVIVNDLEDTVILYDSEIDSLWFSEKDAAKISMYRDEEHISDIVDIRHDQQPTCIRPDALYGMIIG